ncbi:alpha/beta hydrolase [Philodulcilactobacillus myokoensis]|uniref:Alpha/beta hydrolase n=1 Tax=Philodulcilactobacillus myokoensis TaxID=2929573 RepID=A0A9W6B2K4_9LACO|nr:alpha/beta hydrolase [Philodulcilactobacillus myokoensis]GLB47356.1 alpha/beta hydrolase [Philodulcilactobacillus myokoensis]
MNRKLKRFVIILFSLVIVIGIGFVGAGMYFYHVAFIPSHKSFISGQHFTKNSPLDLDNQWYLHHSKPEVWHETSATGHFKLDANYIKAARKTNKTAVIAHGFMGDKSKMGIYAAMFHRMGYNVLVPDDRSAGKSQGNSIGYGWPDRLDYVKWIQKVVKKNGSDSQIVMFGVSMGGATTMMVSGQPDVPKQVKAYIEDCGYTSVHDEIKYQAQQMYHMKTFPLYPLLPILSGIAKVRAGYYLKEASSVNQVKRNHRPMMFIHGANDQFVPTKMVKVVYQADRGPKEMMIVKRAPHAASYQTDPKLYVKSIQKFLAHYIK